MSPAGSQSGTACWAMRLVVTGALAAGCAHARTVAPSPATALPPVETDTSGVPFAPAPEGLLRPGAVEAVQARLQATGFRPSGAQSGRLDAPTREALRRFQAQKDLPATGLPSYRTIEALHLEPDKVFFSAHRPPPLTTQNSAQSSSSSPPATGGNQ